MKTSDSNGGTRPARNSRDDLSATGGADPHATANATEKTCARSRRSKKTF